MDVYTETRQLANEEHLIDPKFLYGIAHKKENNRGTWWYSLGTGEIRISQGKHSDEEFGDISYKEGWIRGRVFEYQGANWLMVYLHKEKITKEQFLDLYKKLEEELDLIITKFVNKEGDNIGYLLESLIERTHIILEK